VRIGAGVGVEGGVLRHVVGACSRAGGLNDIGKT